MTTKKHLLFFAILSIFFAFDTVLCFAGEWSYFVKDHQGNTRVVLDDVGAVKSWYDYYPYGLIQRASIAGSDARFKFTGKEFDSEDDFDMYYFGARFYDPTIARWLVVDPILGKQTTAFLMANGLLSVSPYNYAFNRPTVLTDPDGECPQCVGALIGAGVEYALQVAQTGSFVPTGAGLARIGISALAGAASGGLSTASKIGTVAKIIASGAINSTAGAAKNAVSGNQVTPGSLAADFGIGLASGTAGAITQKVAQTSSAGRALTKTAGRLTNIANTGAPRAAQTARAAAAQTAAQTFGAGPVASPANGLAAGVVGNVLNPGQSIPPNAITNPTTSQPGVANSDNTRTVIYKIVDPNK